MLKDSVEVGSHAKARRWAFVVQQWKQLTDVGGSGGARQPSGLGGAKASQAASECGQHVGFTYAISWITSG